MKIAFPTEKFDEQESPVYNHFGSANFFVIVDTETGACEKVLNQDLNHQHGKCQPVMALGGRIVDAVVVGGIGGSALGKLKVKGVTVYRAVEGTVRENLGKFKNGELKEFMPVDVCSGHGDACDHH
ncbi:NifB/NifX family molybdenum-iron cluster-binding protein [Desulfoluna sp.]|uniref:NifB/NifX family molybdenum-iron cluster-binding protein n=1 Tax=Desulfoluna sp. TaxID=2045199 RepID=UPI002604CA1D|nr:NifB/NifX family molybdenum-iron cluster-binding protein [Desulfoluna sp.]